MIDKPLINFTFFPDNGSWPVLVMSEGGHGAGRCVPAYCAHGPYTY